MLLQLHSLLLVGLVLVGLGSCTKKDDPVLPSGYTFDGVARNCQAKAIVTPASGSAGSDVLEIDLTTTPQPASAAEVLKVFFRKSPGQPVSAYTLSDLTLLTNGTTTVYYISQRDFTLTTTNNGGYSGTFSAKLFTTLSNSFTLKNGIFTDARP